MNKKLETMRDRRLTRDEEKRPLDTAIQKMNSAEHQFVGPLLHGRIIGAIELCCRRGEMLLIQNKRANWETCQIGIPGATTKDKEPASPVQPRGTTRRNPDTTFSSRAGRVRLWIRDVRVPANIQTAWETLKLLAYGYEPKPGREGAPWNREQLQQIDLRWHDLRHEGACRFGSTTVTVVPASVDELT